MTSRPSSLAVQSLQYKKHVIFHMLNLLYLIMIFSLILFNKFIILLSVSPGAIMTDSSPEKNTSTIYSLNSPSAFTDFHFFIFHRNHFNNFHFISLQNRTAKTRYHSILFILIGIFESSRKKNFLRAERCGFGQPLRVSSSGVKEHAKNEVCLQHSVIKCHQ